MDVMEKSGKCEAHFENPYFKQERKAFVRDLLTPIIEKEISKRRAIALPSEGQIINAAHGFGCFHIAKTFLLILQSGEICSGSIICQRIIVMLENSGKS